MMKEREQDVGMYIHGLQGPFSIKLTQKGQYRIMMMEIAFQIIVAYELSWLRIDLTNF